MAKPRVEHWKFWVPIYGAQVILVRSTPKEFVRIVQLYDKDYKREPRGVGLSRLGTAPQQPTLLFLWFADHCAITKAHWLGVVAHECFHGVASLLGHYDIKCTEEAEEAYAYLHGWLVEKCIERLWPATRHYRVGTRKK